MPSGVKRQAVDILGFPPDRMRQRSPVVGGSGLRSAECFEHCFYGRVIPVVLHVDLRAKVLDGSRVATVSQNDNEGET